MRDRDGNCILWGWITETRPDADLMVAGWAGAMSLPRVLSLNSANELQMKVAPAAEQLRGAHRQIPREASPSAKQETVDELRIRDLCAELKLELHPKAGEFAIHLQTESGENFVTISCTSRSEICELQVNEVKASLPGTAGSPVRLHLFLDGSVLEVFANETTALTARVYQIPSGPLHLKLERAEIALLDVWQITPISKDRLTGSLCS
jgi:beta-fructofuranosidase